MDLQEVTPLILTFNEELNIARTLAALTWAKNVVIVDSHSTDATAQIAQTFPNVTLYTRKFDEHTNQWNYGLDCVPTKWVLTLDADYVCSAELPRELESIDDEQAVYYADFKYCVFGKALRATLYPPRAVVFIASELRYVRDGHTQTLDVQDKSTRKLRSVIFHDDRKTLDAWLAAQLKYAKLEADKLATKETLRFRDKLRKAILPAPFIVLVYTFGAKCLFLDGWRGVYYTAQRVYAELLLSLELLDRRFRSN